MRTDLMTANECQERYEAEPTARNALVLSIEKWEAAGARKRWRRVCNDDEPSVWSGDNCGLCRHYRLCISCLIRCTPGSPYAIAADASEESNRPAFMSARKNLLRRMRRALAKLDRETKR